MLKYNQTKYEINLSLTGYKPVTTTTTTTTSTTTTITTTNKIDLIFNF